MKWYEKEVPDAWRKYVRDINLLRVEEVSEGLPGKVE